ncbi:oligopeptide transport system permease protein(OppB) [Metamycoplasma arthritidis]|uniref:Oligopeptide ABC transporter permease protein n=1 Tax=Metamycoplasma arthritidis (strain 158L3-1) TaxID=243272 RepID=B3PN69_META1|nr:ABC transporter permease subunit [Metamycoplasma arthritidis]ACF07471.1 oligopeptide ABC transporter permease protein [Metamycoplasma arthritidis 158L3-1]VEU78992.1 oligopeptide transport system permease protein(OppB) [Metamycoplasma arthritidis]
MKKATQKIAIRALIYIAIFIVAIFVVYFAINLLLTNQIKKNLAVSSQIESNLFSRFGVYLNNLIRGSAGQIYTSELSASGQSISSLYFNQFKWTILFTGLVFLISLIIGNVLGVYSGYKFNRWPDITINIIVIALATIPLILIAILALAFSYLFGYPSQFISEFPLSLQSLLVPILIMLFGTISLFMSRSRKITKEVISSNYYLFAKSFGMSKTALFRKVLFKKLLFNQLQAIVPFYIILLSSSIVIERIFSIPGQSIFVSYAFRYAEINLIMYFFFVNLLMLFLVKFIFSIILDYLNPEQKTEFANFVFVPRRKKAI